MPKKKPSLQDLSVDELRWLLMEKRKTARQDRLERYRRTGRVVTIAPDEDSPSIDRWQAGLSLEDPESEKPARSRTRRILDGLLLLVEISAVLGFIFLLFNGINLIRELNQEAVAGMEQPTLTPTQRRRNSRASPSSCAVIGQCAGAYARA